MHRCRSAAMSNIKQLHEAWELNCPKLVVTLPLANAYHSGGPEGDDGFTGCVVIFRARNPSLVLFLVNRVLCLSRLAKPTCTGRIGREITILAN